MELESGAVIDWFLGPREFKGTMQMMLSNVAASRGQDLTARPASCWRPLAADHADT